MKCNGEIIDWVEDENIEGLLLRLAYRNDPHFAIAVNEIFIQKSAYSAVILKKNDVIDIVKPIAGG